MADTAFSNHKYEESYKFVERAVSLDDSDVDAKLLLAQVQVKLEKTDQAIKTLQDAIRLEPDNQSAYNQLIKIYMENDQPDEVKNLLDSCDNDDILNKFSAYISKNPVFSLPEGSYDEPKTLSLYPKRTKIRFIIPPTEQIRLPQVICIPTVLHSKKVRPLSKRLQ